MLNVKKPRLPYWVPVVTLILALITGGVVVLDKRQQTGASQAPQIPSTALQNNAAGKSPAFDNAPADEGPVSQFTSSPKPTVTPNVFATPKLTPTSAVLKSPIPTPTAAATANTGVTPSNETEAYRELNDLLAKGPITQPTFTITPLPQQRVINITVNAPIDANMGNVQAWMVKNGYFQIPDQNITYEER